MKLRDLIKGVSIDYLTEAQLDIDVKSISVDSRQLMPDGLFVALKGVVSDGNAFIPQALKQGAKVIVKSSPDRQLVDGACIPDDVLVIAVNEPKALLRSMVLNFYDNPSHKVKTIGITGTNGKTTFTYLMEAILKLANHKVGVIGTVNYRVDGRVIPSTNTTPGFVDNQRFLSQWFAEGIDYCVMETSSHALHQGRLDGIDFIAGVFSNLTQDHLDYHGSMEAYFQAKAILFKQLGSQAHAVINVDDDKGKQLIPMTKAKVISYAIDSDAMVRAVNINYALSGTHFEVRYPGGVVKVSTRFIGRHNVYNILSAFACAFAIGIKDATIVEAIKHLTHVPGRLEPVDCGQNFFVFIDYAHTEDGLINVLNGLRAVSQQRIIVVFGCGGDRDKTKRPKMGRAVNHLADVAIVTSDNPRSEDPNAIIQDILSGFTNKQYEVIVDRQQAIEYALSIAKEGEIVLLAGKGHEDYQILKDRTITFNERDIVETVLGH